jgi:hypothetical protein
MSWEIADIYHGFQISVLQLRSGRWVTTVERLPEPRKAIGTAGPCEGVCVPGEFNSQDAAVDAAKNHIDQKHVQR